MDLSVFFVFFCGIRADEGKKERTKGRKRSSLRGIKQPVFAVVVIVVFFFHFRILMKLNGALTENRPEQIPCGKSRDECSNIGMILKLQYLQSMACLLAMRSTSKQPQTNVLEFAKKL